MTVLGSCLGSPGSPTLGLLDSQDGCFTTGGSFSTLNNMLALSAKEPVGLKNLLPRPSRNPLAKVGEDDPPSLLAWHSVVDKRRIVTLSRCGLPQRGHLKILRAYLLPKLITFLNFGSKSSFFN